MFVGLKNISFGIFDFVCDKTIVISDKLHITPIISVVVKVVQTLQIPLIVNTILGLFIKDPMINLEYTAVKTAVDIASQHRHAYNNTNNM